MNYGTIKLLTCIVVIIGMQVLMALPFILGESTVADYLLRSKLTGQGRNGIATTFKAFDFVAALHDRTLFFSWVPIEIYYNKELMADRLKVGMLFFNVYHFFVKKWAFPTCWKNLMDTFSSVPYKGIQSKAQLRNTLEILVLGYMTGIVLMPGGNWQFQFWYMPLVPILFAMLPLPLVSTFWITN
jgi:hypothetical protein